ncbi:MAG TPA: aldehyde dehydrogenase family protein [Euzebyales bacterium]
MRGVDDAVRIANDTDCGLAGAVWSRDADRACGVAGRMRHGTVWINDYHPVVPQTEWGGYGRSGIGRERGVGGLDEYAGPGTSGRTPARRRSTGWFS